MAPSRDNYLTHFSLAIIERLLVQKQLEIEVGCDEQVATYVAQNLAALGSGTQLITSLTQAIISCPDVIELYADDTIIKETITELHTVLARG